MKSLSCFDCIHGKCSVHGTSIKIKSLNAKSLDSVSPPSFFVGRFNYPNVNVGVLSPVSDFDDVNLLDSPMTWFSKGFSISNILNLRSELVNFRKAGSVKNISGFNEKVQEVGLVKSKGFLNFELKKVSSGFKTFKTSAPIGLRAELKSFKLNSAGSSDKRIEKVFYDTDLKSGQALNYLNDKGRSVYKIQQVLSLGMTGLKKNRKLVPTRWSITATDDIIGKSLIREVKDFSQINEFYAGFNEALGNRFLVIFFPSFFGFELIETVNDNGKILTSVDFENYSGRSSYASNTAGGYYASRLSVLRKLKSIRKQAKVLIFREITSDYYASVGVWQVRENVKAACNNLKSYESLEQIIEKFEERFSFNPKNLIFESKVKSWSSQKSVLDF